MSKVYEISLNPNLRLMLFQSGALSLKQALTQKSFSLNQNEIHTIVERHANLYILCFERSNLFHTLRLNKADHIDLFSENRALITDGEKIPWKILKHTLAAPIVCLTAAFIPATLLSSLLFPANLKPLFISNTCYAPCANLMSELTFKMVAPYVIVLGIPLFYLMGCFLAIKFFKFKINRPTGLAIFYVFAAIPFMANTYDLFNKPSVKSTISHWRNNTLNLETISQLKVDFKKDFRGTREAASAHPNPTEE